MSFNKLKDFQEEADKAEKEFLAAHTKDEPTAVATLEPEPQEAAPSEETPVETPAASADEDRYKAAVKAMNEAQRKAADAAKREEEFAKRQTELEAKLNEAIEQARLAMERTPVVADDDDLENDMPDVAKLAERKAKRLMSPLEKRLADMEKRLEEERTVRQRIESDSRAKSMLTEIKAVHPDYDQVVNSEEMATWINEEAPPIYKQIFDGSIPFQPRDAIAVLNAYKQTTTPKAKGNTVSAAEVAAPVKTNPTINPKPAVKTPPTLKEMDWYMHNSHKLTPEQHAEWDDRLSG